LPDRPTIGVAVHRGVDFWRPLLTTLLRYRGKYRYEFRNLLLCAHGVGGTARQNRMLSCEETDCEIITIFARNRSSAANNTRRDVRPIADDARSGNGDQGDKSRVAVTASHAVRRRSGRLVILVPRFVRLELLRSHPGIRVRQLGAVVMGCSTRGRRTPTLPLAVGTSSRVTLRGPSSIPLSASAVHVVQMITSSLVPPPRPELWATNPIPPRPTLCAGTPLLSAAMAR